MSRWTKRSSHANTEAEQKRRMRRRMVQARASDIPDARLRNAVSGGLSSSSTGVGIGVGAEGPAQASASAHVCGFGYRIKAQDAGGEGKMTGEVTGVEGTRERRPIEVPKGAGNEGATTEVCSEDMGKGTKEKNKIDYARFGGFDHSSSTAGLVAAARERCERANFIATFVVPNALCLLAADVKDAKDTFLPKTRVFEMAASKVSEETFRLWKDPGDARVFVHDVTKDS
ncbi:hypothetical protein B0H12DRAFT_1225446 [Mycena haematopus]|nr:hypothetical protein B0H12DRAFT_1225446 [Mycena haematopus]